MTINLSSDRHSTAYNTLVSRIEELRKIVMDPNRLSLYPIITQLLQDAAALEDLYIQGMRDASTETNNLTNKFQQRHKALMARFIEAQTRVQAIELQAQGPGKFVRHAGYYEVTDLLGEKHQVALADVRDQRGVEGRVPVEDPNIDVTNVQFGQKLLLLGTGAPGPIMAVLDEFDTSGREANVVEIMNTDHQGTRVMLSFGDMQEKRVCWLAANVADKDIDEGSRVVVDPTGTLVVEVLPEQQSSRFLVDEIPTTTFADIGGLDHIAAEIQRDFIWPMLYPEKYAIMGLPSPRGCLLSGAPGTGKTMIARAIVNLMSEQIEKMSGVKATGHFFHIGGPELLNKWVGETESHMREIFAQAKKIASPTSPVIIFFDEMDSLFAQRGSGISSDVNLTNVPQFTSLMDGLESRGNVIVVGASNREELIDSAVLRPGRCDKVFRIPRPDAPSAAQIFEKYLLPAWGQINPRYDVDVYTPLDKNGRPKSKQYHFKNDPRNVVTYLIERAVQRMYDPNMKRNEFIKLQLVNADGRRTSKIIRFGDLASGSMIANIVERAKKLALYKHIVHEMPLGIEMKDLYIAIETAFAEQRAPKTLQDMHHWLLIEGQSEGTLVGINFIDHAASDIIPSKSEKDLAISLAIQAEEEEEEF